MAKRAGESGVENPRAGQRARLDAAGVVDNFIDGAYTAPAAGAYMPVVNPASGETVGRVAVSGAADVDAAVRAAKAAFPGWSGMTLKARARVMFKFHELVEEHMEELVELIVRENGKNRTEASASVAKGNETVEFAASLPQLAAGRYEVVSRGVTCCDVRDPLGVVASIVPFNFPFMVPMWTTPIALTMGNCVILKPSEKVPMTMSRVAQLLQEAGVPRGVFQIVNGTADAVNAICDHPEIAAVSFVGSTRVAEHVSKRCRALNKRVLALGGAKNHLVVLADADPEMTAVDVVASFAGCCGQRCMAASVLLPVGDQPQLLKHIVAAASALKRGTGAGECGPLIDAAAKTRVLGYIDSALRSGAELLVDGRDWASMTPGNWVGPTVLLHKSRRDAAMTEEVFGPVLSVYVVHSWEEAILVENSNPYGNAAAVYTSVGAHAEWFQSRFRASMIGVNIGIPVPREPFSFGGMYGTVSKFGDMDITGDGAMEFFRRKITTKWTKPAPGAVHVVDHAHFDGKM